MVDAGIFVLFEAFEPLLAYVDHPELESQKSTGRCVFQYLLEVLEWDSGGAQCNK